MGHIKCNDCGRESLRFHKALDYDKECLGEYTRIAFGTLLKDRQHFCDDCNTPIPGYDVCAHLESLPFKVLKQDPMDYIALFGRARLYFFAEEKLLPAVRDYHWAAAPDAEDEIDHDE